ncbi:hypothetical protein GGI21_005387, partial [Coemansia aciculifera]
MQSKRRPLVIADVYSPTLEAELSATYKLICDDRTQRFTVTGFLQARRGQLVYILVIDTLLMLAINSRRFVFIAILASVTRSTDGPNKFELGTLMAVWQLLALVTPAQSYFES